MIYAHINIVAYLCLLDANIGTPLMFAPVVKGSFWIIYLYIYMEQMWLSGLGRWT
jgi:hypothetical protein